jgi:PTS system mannose-specific IID component
MEEVKRLSRRDIVKAFWRWMFFSHSCYNYERLQALGFAFFIAPIIEELYPKKEDKIAGLKRHLVFFNTEPQIGAPILGATIAMEEQKANGAPITDDDINSFKTGLMGPLAGIGDSITQGVITPIFLAIGIGLAVKGNLFGPILYVILESAAIWGLGYTGFMLGYSQGRTGITQLLKSGILTNLLKYAGFLGCSVLGALVAQFVSLSTPISMTVGGGTLKLQDMLDKIIPGLLPLAATLVIFYYIRKGKNVNVVLLWIIIVGVVGALIGLF